jgi:hypothetical protein
VVSITRRLLYPQEKNRGTHWTGSWVGNQRCCGRLGRSINFFPLAEFQPRTSQTSLCLDRAIPAFCSGYKGHNSIKNRCLVCLKICGSQYLLQLHNSKEDNSVIMTLLLHVSAYNGHIQGGGYQRK